MADNERSLISLPEGNNSKKKIDGENAENIAKQTKPENVNQISGKKTDNRNIAAEDTGERRETSFQKARNSWKIKLPAQIQLCGPSQEIHLSCTFF